MKTFWKINYIITACFMVILFLGWNDILMSYKSVFIGYMLSFISDFIQLIICLPVYIFFKNQRTKTHTVYLILLIIFSILDFLLVDDLLNFFP